MATTETTINGRTIVVSLDIDNNGTFFAVACLTENGMPTSRAPIDITSKCGNAYVAGDVVTQTITGSGIAINSTGTPARESYSSLYTLMKNKTVCNCIFGPAAPTTGDTYYTGMIVVSELTITASDKDVLKFSFVFTPTLPPLAQVIY